MEKSNAITKYDKYLKVVKICVAVFCILFAIFVLLSA